MDRGRIIQLLALLLIGGGALVAAHLAPAQALTGQGIKFDDQHQHARQSYGPIPGADPVSGQAGSATDPTLSNCQSGPGDVLVQIDISFKRQVGTLDDFVTSWGGAGNDVDTYFFDGGGKVIAKATSGDTDKPEIVRLGNLTNGTYYLCVVNFSGANTGFVIDAKRQFLTLYKYTPPPDAPLPKAGGNATPPPAVTATPDATPSAPPITAEPVVTPGPNGPNAKQGLVGVAGAEQASNKTKRSIAELVFLILTVVIAVVGIGFVAMRIRRDTT